uniref:EMI domain-containing protein n=1 Tax=Xiphophorus couchianus TaxID=32473 RepID=A0A3B5L219_9TELE
RKSVQLVAEECKTWRHVQNQSPCPRESPGCQRAMYRLRPGCQKQKEVTTLVWRCCPGHGGPNCDQEGEIRKFMMNVETYNVPAALPVPDMMALVLSQLHPILEGFNRSLERLHHHVGALSQDVAEMKVSRRGVEPQEEEDAEEKLESNLDGMFQEIGNVRRQIQEWRSDTESRLNSQRDELQLHLSSFRLEVEQELKQQQKVLQVRNYHQWSQSGTLLPTPSRQHGPVGRHHTAGQHGGQQHRQGSSNQDSSWCASVQVEELTEDLDITSADGQQMALQLKNLEKLINQTARKSQILFMETGLEVEKSKVTVEQLVEQLVVNLTRYEKDLRENTKDVDNLYKDFHNLNPTKDCKCSDLNAAVTRLERGVANVTQLANQNRLELEENSEVGGNQRFYRLKVTLVLPLQVKQSMALEQNRTRTLDLGLAQLSGSVSALQDEDVQLDQQVKTLSTSFQSLLQDAIRHSDVLQLLLGEEVLEFLEWPLQDQEAHSVPALQEQLRQLQDASRRRSGELQTVCETWRGRWSSRSRGWSGRRRGAAPVAAARRPLQDGRRRCRWRCSGCGGAWRNT